MLLNKEKKNRIGMMVMYVERVTYGNDMCTDPPFDVLFRDRIELLLRDDSPVFNRVCVLMSIHKFSA